MKGPVSILLLLLFSCNKPAEEQANGQEQRLHEAFETQWGEKSAGSDSVRLALASLSGRSEYILYCRAWKLAGEGNNARALKTADSLVMGFPSFEKGIYLRANLRLEAKDTSGSLDDFERCLKRNPGFFECLMNRGSLFFSKKMPDLAYRDFREALKIKPKNSQARFNLGNTQFALGQADSACFQWKIAEDAGMKEAAEIREKLCRSSK
jgi:tetratricopeptide (TPR) repeat protein